MTLPLNDLTPGVPFGIWVNPRMVELLFDVDDKCVSCGYDKSEHRLVFPEEMSSEWRICGTERLGPVFFNCAACGEEMSIGHNVCENCGEPSPHKDVPDKDLEVTRTRYYCILKKGRKEYMTREEFEELYNDE